MSRVATTTHGWCAREAGAAWTMCCGAGPSLRLAPRGAAHARSGAACQTAATRPVPQDRGERSAIADNVLDRQFQAETPNQKLVANFTYIWTTEGWLYVAVVLDLYSRRIVGWSMQASMTCQIVADALMMAVWRCGRPQELLHHSDQGKPVHERALPAAAG